MRTAKLALTLLSMTLPFAANAYGQAQPTWTQKFPTMSPPTRASTAMVFDTARNEVILFGGAASGGGFYNDTWAWDGNNWVQKSPATAPPGREQHELAYDSS